ncbi:uncharacterized protein ACBT57_020216 [Dama dama]
MEPTSLTSSALAGGFFTTSATYFTFLSLMSGTVPGTEQTAAKKPRAGEHGEISRRETTRQGSGTSHWALANLCPSLGARSLSCRMKQNFAIEFFRNRAETAHVGCGGPRPAEKAASQPLSHPCPQTRGMNGLSAPRRGREHPLPAESGAARTQASYSSPCLQPCDCPSLSTPQPEHPSESLHLIFITFHSPDEETEVQRDCFCDSGVFAPRCLL